MLITDMKLTDLVEKSWVQNVKSEILALISWYVFSMLKLSITVCSVTARKIFGQPALMLPVLLIQSSIGSQDQQKGLL